MGYIEWKPGYRIWCQKTRNTVRRRDVFFEEMDKIDGTKRTINNSTTPIIYKRGGEGDQIPNKLLLERNEYKRRDDRFPGIDQDNR